MSAGRPDYDAVIVGARCGGAPTAARLAEAGRRVLLVDREPPPADTLSSHVLFPNTLARLRELGALERIEARHTLNPAIYAARMLGEEFEGAFTPVGGFDRLCGITRPVLDEALLEVAVAAGAETRFGEKVTGLLGEGTEADPVRGVVLASGEPIRAGRVLAADGRASTVARLLGLEKERPLVGEMAFMFGYWRGLPPSDRFQLEVLERASLSVSPCEDDLSILILGCEPELTRGNAEQRRRRFLGALEQFGDHIDLEAIGAAEAVGQIRVAPETMLRGFFRRATGPGWALVGDAGHFKHPATAQGISDAIEQGLHLAEELVAGDDLEGYEAWREERAREHYEWSFDFGRFPKPETARPLFRGIASDPAAAQDFRDSFARLTRPRSDVLSRERLGRWFAPALNG
jgi:2-polyprenyl-6-methoxyphenol hydroxylase-like FAD-dependent oxidoreductase